MPRWSGGFLISWQRNTLNTDKGDNVIAYKRDGTVAASWRLWFPDASLVEIIDAAGSPGGQVVVTGLAAAASGALTGFLAYMSTRESVARVVQTSPFEGQHLDFGPDGTIWVLGYQLGDMRKMKAAPEHSALRRYDGAGMQVGEYLRWPAVNCGLHPAAALDGGEPQVTTSGDRIGIFLPACHMWMEFSPEGELLSSLEWRQPPQQAATPGKRDINRTALRVVMTKDNRVFGMFGRNLFSLDRTTGAWSPVSIPPAVGKLDWLIGSDGDQVVYRPGGTDLFWAKLE